MAGSVVAFGAVAGSPRTAVASEARRNPPEAASLGCCRRAVGLGGVARAYDTFLNVVKPSDV